MAMSCQPASPAIQPGQGIPDPAHIHPPLAGGAEQIVSKLCCAFLLHQFVASSLELQQELHSLFPVITSKSQREGPHFRIQRHMGPACRLTHDSFGSWRKECA